MALSRHFSKRLLQHSRFTRPCRVVASSSQVRKFSSLQGKTTRIGCASGFWGDSAMGAPQLVKQGNIDFLVLDYLSEITMSLMTAARQKMPNMGYAPDFVQAVMAPCIRDIKKKGVRVLTNAGGVNPQACAEAVQKVAKDSGIDIKVAVVLGDDLMPYVKDVKGHGVVDMHSQMAFPKGVHSMNAYFGAGALSRALDHGADIVISGRCTDSALVLAPLVHTYKWSVSDFDTLAAGSLAGHLIECGAQVTGGIFTDWDKSPNWENIGFPIVEVAENGDFVVTKPPGTGGLVSPATVSEQLLYEIGDPQNYILPDVVCDFSNVSMETVKDNEAVLVRGTKGKAPTKDFKVCATYLDGYRATAVCPVGGPRAVAKARKTGESIIKRTRGLYKMLGMEDFTRTNLQILGSEGTYGANANPELVCRESVIWLAVHHQQKKALELFAREIAPAGTGMAPGLCGIVGGRPRVSPVLKLFSFLYPKEKMKAQIEIDGVQIEEYSTPYTETSSADDTVYHPPTIDSTPLCSGANSYRLEQLAYTRSGDKGNSVNIGVVARTPELVAYLREQLTAEAVENYFSHLFDDRTGPLTDRIERCWETHQPTLLILMSEVASSYKQMRGAAVALWILNPQYEVPGIHGFNFLLKNALGGGGVASLRSDPQGKAVAQMLLDFTLKDMPNVEGI